MPIRGSKVYRRGWFRLVEAKLLAIGFKRGLPPSGMSTPGFYFYDHPSGIRVQIAAENTIRIRRPDGRHSEDRVPQFDDAMLVLDALDLDITCPD